MITDVPIDFKPARESSRDTGENRKTHHTVAPYRYCRFGIRAMNAFVNAGGQVTLVAVSMGLPAVVVVNDRDVMPQNIEDFGQYLKLINDFLQVIDFMDDEN